MMCKQNFWLRKTYLARFSNIRTVGNIGRVYRAGIGIWGVNLESFLKPDVVAILSTAVVDSETSFSENVLSSYVDVTLGF